MPVSVFALLSTGVRRILQGREAPDLASTDLWTGDEAKLSAESIPSGRRDLMAGFRLPGVLGIVTNAMPTGAGLPVRNTSSPRGPVGTAEESRLSAEDLDFIRRHAGRNLDGSVKPLQELLFLRSSHIGRKAEFTRELGARGWHGAVAYEQEAIDVLSALIEEAQSPVGRAAEHLESLIEQYEKKGGQVTDEQLSQAFEEPLALERQAQLRGSSNGDRGSKLTALIVRGLNAAAKRNNDALSDLLKKAELPGSAVTDEQLRNAFQKVLGIERQRQLLGASDENASGPNAMDLVGKGIALSVRRKNDVLKDCIEKARHPGSPVTNDQLREAVREVLDAERQAQLLGVADTGSGGQSGLARVVDAARVLHERAATALGRRLSDPTASEEQIRQATEAFEAEKRQLRLLGADVPEGRVGEGRMKIQSG